MDVRHLTIAGAKVLTPRQFTDSRGTFLEWFTLDSFRAATGQRLSLAQANCSVSAAGVLRGVHFAAVPPGQAKYVFCSSGAVLDVVVDLRVGSPTFGQWESVLLDDVDRCAVYLPEGLGHAFLSLADGSTVVYLCSEGYSPDREHGVNPLDTDLAIAWPTTNRDGTAVELRLSDKDRDAPSLREVLAAGRLPTLEACTAYTEELRDPAGP